MDTEGASARGEGGRDILYLKIANLFYVCLLNSTQRKHMKPI